MSGRSGIVDTSETLAPEQGDVKGVIRAYLPELKKGENYSYLLTAEGYDEVAGELVAHTGVMHRVDLVLKRAVMSAVPSSEGVKKIG